MLAGFILGWDQKSVRKRSFFDLQAPLILARLGMKIASKSLLLAALAVTAAHAGSPYLRSSGSEGLEDELNDFENEDMTVKGGKTKPTSDDMLSGFISDKIDISDTALSNDATKKMFSKNSPIITDVNAGSTGKDVDEPFLQMEDAPIESTTNKDDDTLAMKSTVSDDNIGDGSMTDNLANNPFQMEDVPSESTTNDDDDSLATKSAMTDDDNVVGSMSGDNLNDSVSEDDIRDWFPKEMLGPDKGIFFENMLKNMLDPSREQKPVKIGDHSILFSVSDDGSDVSMHWDVVPEDFTANSDDNSLAAESIVMDDNIDDGSMTDNLANSPFQMEDVPSESTTNDDDDILATKTAMTDDDNVAGSMTGDILDNPLQMDDVSDDPNTDEFMGSDSDLDLEKILNTVIDPSREVKAPNFDDDFVALNMANDGSNTPLQKGDVLVDSTNNIDDDSLATKPTMSDDNGSLTDNLANNPFQMEDVPSESTTNDDGDILATKTAITDDDNVAGSMTGDILDNPLRMDDVSDEPNPDEFMGSDSDLDLEKILNTVTDPSREVKAPNFDNDFVSLNMANDGSNIPLQKDDMENVPGESTTNDDGDILATKTAMTDDDNVAGSMTGDILDNPLRKDDVSDDPNTDEFMGSDSDLDLKKILNTVTDPSREVKAPNFDDHFVSLNMANDGSNIPLQKDDMENVPDESTTNDDDDILATKSAMTDDDIIVGSMSGDNLNDPISEDDIADLLPKEMLGPDKDVFFENILGIMEDVPSESTTNDDGDILATKTAMTDDDNVAGSMTGDILDNPLRMDDVSDEQNTDEFMGSDSDLDLEKILNTVTDPSREVKTPNFDDDFVSLNMANDGSNIPLQKDDVLEDSTNNIDDDSLATKSTMSDDNGSLTDDLANNPFQMEDVPSESTTNDVDDSLATKTATIDDDNVLGSMTGDILDNPLLIDDVSDESDTDKFMGSDSDFLNEIPANFAGSSPTDTEGVFDDRNSDNDYGTLTDDVSSPVDVVSKKDATNTGKPPVISGSSQDEDSPLQFESPLEDENPTQLQQ
ncbi:hypothetical protein Plhal304r1_c022g0076391 [Plasmopara halstedii]